MKQIIFKLILVAVLLLAMPRAPFCQPGPAAVQPGQTTAEHSDAPMPAWQKSAGGTMQFEVASVRLDTSGVFKTPSIALSADDGSQPIDGFFHSDFPLIVDIQFAYKVSLSPEQRQAMLARLPKWVTTDTYLIEASSPGKPTKDQVRLMMQSLLADRFGLKLHFETPTVPVFALTLVKPGKLGPGLRAHSEGVPCSEPASSSTAPNTQSKPPFPGACGIYGMHPTTGDNVEMGARDTTMPLLAAALPSLGGLGRPVVDQTGLTGHYDFTVEFSQQATRNAMRNSTEANTSLETQGTTFLQAVREQLGLKLEPIRAPVQTLVVDHIERPSEN